MLSGNKNKSLRGTTFFKRFEKVSDEKLKKIIKGTNYKVNVDNIKIKARGGAAISPLNRQPNVEAAAISASNEPIPSIADFVDKSIKDYTEAKKANAQNMIGSTIYGLQVGNEVKNDSNYSKQFNNYDTTVDENGFSEQEYYIFSECHSRVIGKFANEVLMQITKDSSLLCKPRIIAVSEPQHKNDSLTSKNCLMNCR